MRKTLLGMIVVSASLLAFLPAAHAQASAGAGTGVGVQSTITGLTGPAFAYQAPRFHLDGILGVRSTNNLTTFQLGGHFWYEVHEAELADFSLGGGLTIANVDPDPGEGDTFLHLELGAQLRAFLAPNVALSTSLGLAFVAADGDDTLGILGQLTGAMGVTYYFF